MMIVEKQMEIVEKVNIVDILIFCLKKISHFIIFNLCIFINYTHACIHLYPFALHQFVVSNNYHEILNYLQMVLSVVIYPIGFNDVIKD